MTAEIPNRNEMTVASDATRTTPIERPATGLAQAMAVLKVVALVLAGAAGSVIATAQAGVALPAWLVSVATAVVAIAAPLGIASPGLEKKP